MKPICSRAALTHRSSGPLTRGAIAAIAVLITTPCAFADAPSPNITTVEIGSGPFAGNYKADNTACLIVKARRTLGSGWKDFSPPPHRKALEEAGVEVHDADAPGNKVGTVIVTLLDGVSPTPKSYQLNQVPLSVNRTGLGGRIEFDGKAPDGVRIHLIAMCVDVEQF